MKTAWLVLKFVAVFYAGLLLLALQCLVSRDARRRYLYGTRQLKAAATAKVEQRILEVWCDAQRRHQL